MTKNTKIILGIIIAVVIIGGIWLGVGRKADAPNLGGNEVIKIGAILPLTGKLAQYSEEVRRGIELALEEEQDLGLKIIYEDSQGDPKNGISAYQRLKAMGVSAVVTGRSTISLAIAPLANQDKTIQMGVFSSVAKYTSPNDFTFRVTARSEIEDKKIAEWTINHGYSSLALLYMNDEWGLGHRNFIKEEVEKLGGNIIIEETFLKSDSDFRTQLIKIKNKNVEGIFLIASGGTPGIILKQAKELGLEKQFFGVRAVESPELLLVAEKAAEGIIYPYSFNPVSDISRVQEFTKKYQEKYNAFPTTYVAEGYDSMKLIIKSVKACDNKVNTECMKNDLLNTENYPGILGKMTFDENGDVFYPYFIKTVKDGQFVPYEESK